MAPIEQLFLDFAATVWVRLIAGLIVANVLTGFAVALSPATDERFYLGQVAEFLFRRIFAYLLCYLAVAVLAYAAAGTAYRGWADGIVSAIGLAIVSALVGKIMAQLKQLGFNVPEPFTDRPAPPAKPQV